MQFKIRDKVRVKKCNNSLLSYDYSEYMGEEGTIKNINYDDCDKPYEVYFNDIGCSEWFDENELIFIKHENFKIGDNIRIRDDDGYVLSSIGKIIKISEDGNTCDISFGKKSHNRTAKTSNIINAFEIGDKIKVISPKQDFEKTTGVVIEKNNCGMYTVYFKTENNGRKHLYVPDEIIKSQSGYNISNRELPPELSIIMDSISLEIKKCVKKCIKEQFDKYFSYNDSDKT